MTTATAMVAGWQQQQRQKKQQSTKSCSGKSGNTSILLASWAVQWASKLWTHISIRGGRERNARQWQLWQSATVLACGSVWQQWQCAALSGTAMATCSSSPLVVIVVGRWRGRRRRAMATELYGAITAAIISTKWTPGAGGETSLFLPQMVDTKHLKILK